MGYQEYKTEVLTLFDHCIKFAQENNYSDSIEKMESSKKKVEENRLVIMTCGEMRMGKSSLLATYLEDKALFPVDVDVTTCLITMVSYAETEKITVVFENNNGDENSLEISRAEIADYAKEQNNRHNHKKAKLILIETPNEKLKNGLIFVDTPGVGSMNIEHSEMTYEFIPRADLILFVSDATKPYTEPELGFLERINRSGANIVFIMTKMDIQQDYMDIISKNKAMIEAKIGIPADRQIFLPVSSKLQMMYQKTGDSIYREKSNFPKLEELLWTMITKNRASILITPRLRELKNELGLISADIKIKETAYSGDSDKILILSNRLNELSEKRQVLLSENANWQMDVSGKVVRLGTSVKTQVSVFQQDVSEMIISKLKQKQYVDQPYKLVDEVVCLTVQQSQKMREMLEDGIYRIKTEFEQESGLNLDMQEYSAEFSVEENSGIVFEKVSNTDKMMSVGAKIGGSGFRIGALGTVVGAVLGGIIGFLGGGPTGALFAGKAGAGILGAIGSAGGTIKGSLDALKDPHNYDPASIRQELQKYINRTVTGWNDSQQKIMSDLNINCTRALRLAINESKQRIDNDIETIQKSRQMNAEEQKKEWMRLQEIKKQYMMLMAAFKKAADSVTTINDDTDYTEPDLDD